MTLTDIQRLRALAEKATPVAGREAFWPSDRVNYYAALDPATVIALCDLAEKAHPEPAQAQVSHGVRYATVRDAGDDEHWDIECRFVNGEKYAAVQVVKEKEQLADWIARALSAPLPDGRS